MITRDHAQEGLSRAYVQAVSAAARVNAQLGDEFDYGFDGTFYPVIDRGFSKGGKHRERFINDGFPIQFQLKCSWKWKDLGEEIQWSIKTKTYNDLAFRNNQQGGVKALLILMCLPNQHESLWLTQSDEHLTLQKCCYYDYINGPQIPNDGSTKTITIPKKNLFTAAALREVLENEKKLKMGLFS